MPSLNDRYECQHGVPPVKRERISVTWRWFRPDFLMQLPGYPPVPAQLPETAPPPAPPAPPTARRSRAEVALSKKLSHLLRHGAVKAGLRMRPDGYALLADVFSEDRIERIEKILNNRDRGPE